MGAHPILRTIPNFYPYVTGPANQAWQVARRLSQCGFDESILTTDEGAMQAPAEEEREGVRITRLRRSRLGVLAYRWVPGGRARLRAEPAALIHAHSYRNCLTTLARREARRRRIPYVLQPHGQLLMYQHLLGLPGQVPYRCFDALTRKREVQDAAAVIVASGQERDEALAFGVPPERLHLIPVGVAARHDPPAERGQQSTLRVLFVGRIAPGRNPQQLIRAVAQLPASVRQHIEVRLVGPSAARTQFHRGDSYVQRLRAEAGERGVSEHCQFLGPQYGADLDAQYQHADVFVYPSRYENFGQSVLEAGDAGLPVLATATGVAADLIRDGETGYHLALDDPAQLANLLHRLVEDRQAVARMGQAMHQHVQQHYRWDHVIEQYRSLYRQLLG